LLEDVGEDGGAFGGDAVFGEEAEEVGEEEVDVGGGFDVLEFAEEIAFEVGEVGVFQVKGEVGGAEGGGGVLGRKTATAAGEGAVLAAGESQGVGGALVAMGDEFHGSPRRMRFEEMGSTPYPQLIAEECASD